MHLCLMNLNISAHKIKEIFFWVICPWLLIFEIFLLKFVLYKRHWWFNGYHHRKWTW